MKRWLTTLLALMMMSLAMGAGTTTAPAAAKQPSALHTELVTSYMEGKWDALETLLKDKAREIAALEKTEAADVAIIKAALAEGRPAWWAAVKTKKKVDIKINLWGRTLPATFDPECASNWQYSLNPATNAAAVTVRWLIADMDNAAPAEHGFSKADLGHMGIFSILGTVDTMAILPPLSKQLDDAGTAALNSYLEFRAGVTSLAYGTPRSRQWGCYLFLLSYKKEYEKLGPARTSRKAVAAMFLSEILSHPETYPSIRLPKTLAADDAEETLALDLAPWIEKHQWSFAEDNALRAALKQFGAANLAKPHTTGKVELPNKLLIALDPEADKPLKAKRDAWIKQQFDKAAKKTAG